MNDLLWLWASLAIGIGVGLCLAFGATSWALGIVLALLFGFAVYLAVPLFD
jgi:hypothetical protein